jgi:hypothetical protein
MCMLSTTCCLEVENNGEDVSRICGQRCMLGKNVVTTACMVVGAWVGSRDA